MFLIHSFVLESSFAFQVVMRSDIGSGQCLLNVDGLCRALLVLANDCALVRM